MFTLCQYLLINFSPLSLWFYCWYSEYWIQNVEIYCDINIATDLFWLLLPWHIFLLLLIYFCNFKNTSLCYLFTSFSSGDSILHAFSWSFLTALWCFSFYHSFHLFHLENSHYSICNSLLSNLLLISSSVFIIWKS